jgi:hypothetical protein
MAYADKIRFIVCGDKMKYKYETELIIAQYKLVSMAAFAN